MGKHNSNLILRRVAVLALACLLSFGDILNAWACPFCDVTQQTMSEEFASSDASVIAVQVKPAEPVAGKLAAAEEGAERDPFEEDETGAYKGAEFKIVEVIRGDFKPGDIIETVYFGEDAADKQFLIRGIQGDQLEWGTPLPLSPAAVEYVKQLPLIPQSGRDRLHFFMGYLENNDPLLAQDSYDEFARAPYQDLIDLKDALDRHQLVEWILDSQVGPTRRRLYLTMLGVCGTQEDVAMLEKLLKYDYESLKPGLAAMIGVMDLGGSAIGAPLVDELVQADVRAKQQCLDALIAAYLKLKGPEGLAVIEDRFLKNPKTEYTQQYSTIMALRFHGEESSEIPRERLVQTMRLLLDNEEIADQVIPDLTRWEDWEIMDQLVEKFKASEKDGWIRQPVVAYLLTAAEQSGEVGEKANAAVAELEEIDPEGVKRARSYLAFGLTPGGGKASAAKKSAGETAKSESAQKEPKAVTAAKKPTPAKQKLTSGSQVLAAPSKTTIIVVPVVVGILLMGLFSVMLRGGHASASQANSSQPPAP